MMNTVGLSLLGAFGFWLQLTLGCLGILLIQDVTGGRWGIYLRPFLIWSLPTLYTLFPAFIVVAALHHIIYIWPANSTMGNNWLYFSRGSIYFALWIGIARGFRSRERLGKPTRTWSAGSLLVLSFSISFAAMDWFMTLDPRWSSTGFGVIFIGGALCAGFAFATIVSLVHLKDTATENQARPILIELGNLILISILFWAYVDFMQYLIIWSGQLPKEISWYDNRSRGGWSIVIALAAVSGLAIPFVLLLFRSLKRRPWVMRSLAASVFLSRLLENIIIVSPTQKVTALEALLWGILACIVVRLPWRWIYHRQENAEPESTYQAILLRVEK